MIEHVIAWIALIGLPFTGMALVTGGYADSLGEWFAIMAITVLSLAALAGSAAAMVWALGVLE